MLKDVYALFCNYHGNNSPLINCAWQCLLVQILFLKAILRESLNTNNKSNEILRIQMYINMISFGFPPHMSCETYM